jgi:hypothetical protein
MPLFIDSIVRRFCYHANVVHLTRSNTRLRLCGFVFRVRIHYLNFSSTIYSKCYKQYIDLCDIFYFKFFAWIALKE